VIPGAGNAVQPGGTSTGVIGAAPAVNTGAASALRVAEGVYRGGVGMGLGALVVALVL